MDERLGVDEGDTITLSGMEFEVVAERSGGTYFAGVPTVVAALSDVQRLGLEQEAVRNCNRDRGQRRCRAAQGVLGLDER